MGSPSRARLTVVPTPIGVAPARSPSRGELGLVPADFAFLEVVEIFCSLRVLEAWAEMRALLCDDARLESIAADGVAGPDGTIEAMRFAAAGEAYTVQGYELEALADDVVLVEVLVTPQDAPEEEARPVLWLVSGQGRLLWRSRIVSAREEALQLLDLHGDGLGL